jgi:hypothetical protein
VFGDWVPGEPATDTVVDGSGELSGATVQNAAEDAEPEPDNGFLDSDVFGAAVGLVPDAVAEPIAVPFAELRSWVPSDDDILPSKKRFRLTLHR